MNASTIQQQPTDMEIIEKMTGLRADIDALDINDLQGLSRVVIGKIKQQFSSTMFWYQQWNRNRDYSSVTNATMALGKLASLIEIFPCAVENSQK